MSEQQANPDLVEGPGPAIVTDERTGRQYVSTYLYQRQFEAEFDEATRFLIHKYGTKSERFAWVVVPLIIFGSCFAIHGVANLLVFLLSKTAIATWLTFLMFVVLGAFSVAAITWAVRGKARFHNRLIDQRLCFGCGYALIGQEVDQRGHGRCPECGKSFNVTRYLRPPRRYHGVARP